jgi:glutamate synthase domain-containing protein 1/glutamate synthase domain-containing protein 3
MPSSELNPGAVAERIIASRAALTPVGDRRISIRKGEAEGGCGVIGMACSEAIQGRHLLQALIQMRNRGNGKGGGVALAGIAPQAFGVAPEVMATDYLLAIAYLEPDARRDVERNAIYPAFHVDHVHELTPSGLPGLDPAPPTVVLYFVRPQDEALRRFAEQARLHDLPPDELADEFVYQNSYRLNRAYYASLGEKRAFVLSHGKDLLVLKLVGYGDDVVRAYGLEDLKAHVWIGHHRYPTKGRVWHPGGAHPFVGLHEALVHNGDFANYASVCSYLAQHNIYPLFLTDTEVSVLMFDLLHRTFRYPLEYVIETLAPTTERDFTMLPPERRAAYGLLQTTHMHGSPDGPWYFLLAQSLAHGSGPREARLIGITDTSMLRPQVFALQQGMPGSPSIGMAASERQAIDAALRSLAEADPRFWPYPDRTWSARGGSHTDGGAFIFSVLRNPNGTAELHCRDKFGRQIEIEETTHPFPGPHHILARPNGNQEFDGSAEELTEEFMQALPRRSAEDVARELGEWVGRIGSDPAREVCLQALTQLLDRRYPTGQLRRSSLRSLLDSAMEAWAQAISENPSDGFGHVGAAGPLPGPTPDGRALVVDARGFAAEGSGSLALALRELVQRGYRRLVLVNVRGQRFIGNGLGSAGEGVQIDVFGSPGDYLASGIDGAVIRVHGSGQDQLGQIMKAGRLVVYGDVGQTFMYGAKGGEAYVQGNTAGRPLINAVGKPKVVINGTCLDYLAESFMAGDALNGGGFVVVNGLAIDSQGMLRELETPYPGGNLFSLASGGAIFIRDPLRLVGEDQLNGGQFAGFEQRHWDAIRPTLEENARLFHIPMERLLQSQGRSLLPEEVYRVVVPAGHQALQPEQAWVAHR